MQALNSTDPVPVPLTNGRALDVIVPPDEVLYMRESGVGQAVPNC